MKPGTLGAALAALCVLGAAEIRFTSAPAAQSANNPRLAVLIMVDQMRADYVDRFQSNWTAGLRRMVTRGAWFRNAAYPYLNTYTCAGHATVSTGAFPRRHGIIQNQWWDRETRSLPSCTADRDTAPVSYGEAITGAGDSAFRLQVPTFADLMRTQRGARVVTLALKDRSAIMMAGHGGDAVTWLAPTGDRWTTSTAFAAAPVPAVKSFTDAHPIGADYGKIWSRLLPASRYRQPDDADGELPPSGWTRTFPHVLNGRGEYLDASFYNQWQRSPFSSDYLGALAASLVETLKLGQRPTTDVLAVSFSGTDLVGHAFGPDSQEVQDIYAHLDRTIGRLLDQLDKVLGPEMYVVALSADHGVTPIPEQMARLGKDGGRLSAATLTSFIDTRVQSALGPGRYVSRVNGNDVYFEPGMYDRLSADSNAMAAVIDAVKQAPGIADIYPEARVRSGAASTDPLLRAAALSYFPGRSGDMILASKPGWIYSATGATHGTANPDDQRVPVIFFGRGVRRGVFEQPATPADVAPTLAALCGLTMQNVDGQVLKMALR
jgi:predicted AlkP superfamily pyrophosphatase or phosphodiesterase